MIAVSNTIPLRYLMAIGEQDLPGKLWEKVFVPAGVYEELTEAKTPEVREAPASACQSRSIVGTGTLGVLEPADRGQVANFAEILKH
jgi:hypothetical protein